MSAKKNAAIFLLLFSSFALSASICLEWEKEIAKNSSGAEITREQYAGGRSRALRKIYKKNGRIYARYKFLNFNRDRISVTYSMKRKHYLSYLGKYGYRKSEIARLRAERDKTRRQVWSAAYKIGGRPAAERALKMADDEYLENLRKFLASRGFKLTNGDTVEADIPLIAGKNKRLMNSLARTFQRIARSRGYDSYDTIGAVLSMVQTGIAYKVPPMSEKGKRTGGILPPARALLSGWGDCDTKSALFMSILSNWKGMKMVGIAIPHHYLVGIRRIPGKGDFFVRYGGAEYVLVEPTGPAWLPPGKVGTGTEDYIRTSAAFRIEPI